MELFKLFCILRFLLIPDFQCGRLANSSSSLHIMFLLHLVLCYDVLLDGMMTTDFNIDTGVDLYCSIHDPTAGSYQGTSQPSEKVTLSSGPECK